MKIERFASLPEQAAFVLCVTGSHPLKGFSYASSFGRLPFDGLGRSVEGVQVPVAIGNRIISFVHYKIAISPSLAAKGHGRAMAFSAGQEPLLAVTPGPSRMGLKLCNYF